MGAVVARVGAVVALLGAVGACSSGPRGLGRGACPYVRPRLIRLGGDRLHTAADLPDIATLSQDVGLYVQTDLPAGGRARSDQALVHFSRALAAFVAGQGQGPPVATLDAATAALQRECRVPGY